MIADDSERVPYELDTHRGSIRTARSYSQRGSTVNEQCSSLTTADFFLSIVIVIPLSKLKKTSKRCEPCPLKRSRIVQKPFRLSSVTIRRCVTGEARRR